MPFCTKCGDRFQGRGTLCAYHNIPIYTKTYDTYNTAEPYYTHDASHRHYYDSPHRPHYSNYNAASLFPSPRTSNTQLQVAAHQFRKLADDYAINHMTFNSHPNGTRSVQVSANKDREQCSVCKKWFADHQKLELHLWEFPSGCEEHEVCFRQEEEYFHGTTYRHGRCFVRGCQSIYRREGGWKSGVVERHVRDCHFY
ncbi:hypothetical protein K469DRAFT_593836 [Zopfia rhizophila CBS 207.26]|uniref:Uncharacterized protein n=1 Tax=Zopfia rhizophila CBS 207.26 TaxID=1314779 RepID=A0A6A6DM26_9PEZI|nr:hypothetical protein K469DRAFT_593836 [Zopfia rhizophila CBS 207.26]